MVALEGPFELVQKQFLSFKTFVYQQKRNGWSIYLDVTHMLVFVSSDVRFWGFLCFIILKLQKHIQKTPNSMSIKTSKRRSQGSQNERFCDIHFRHLFGVHCWSDVLMGFKSKSLRRSFRHLFNFCYRLLRTSCGLKLRFLWWPNGHAGKAIGWIQTQSLNLNSLHEAGCLDVFAQ